MNFKDVKNVDSRWENTLISNFRTINVVHNYSVSYCISDVNLSQMRKIPFLLGFIINCYLGLYKKITLETQLYFLAH